MTNLSVNLNKVALLKNQRDVGYPDVAEHGLMILEAGAQGLTVHPRPDERHIRKSDVPVIAALIAQWNDGDHPHPVEFNIEGYPDDDFIDLVTKHDCHQVTLVPDDPHQRTSDHGWDIPRYKDQLKEIITHLKDKNRRVSLFLDPVPELIKEVKDIHADHIELYTGPYAMNETPLNTYAQCAQKAEEMRIGVNAGHDLSLDNLARFIAAIPTCAEVSIGHAITADALKMGWNAAVNAYLTAIRYGHKASRDANIIPLTPEKKFGDIMNYILTLLASDVPVHAAHIGMVEGVLEQNAVLITGKPKWVEPVTQGDDAPHQAAKLPIAEALTIDQIKKLRDILADDRVDVFCTPERRAPYRLFLADMDSTIVTNETLDELANEAGIKEQIALITDRAMRGELNFHTALKERVALLAGLSQDALTRTLDQTTLSTGAVELVTTLKKSGTRCVLVSGGFTYFTGAIAAQVGFDTHHGNILDITDGQLTGTVSDPILDKEAKLAFLRQYVQEMAIDMADSIAIGDGANDLPMLAHAGLGIGYRPKPLLADSLLNCLFYADLSAIQYIL